MKKISLPVGRLLVVAAVALSISIPVAFSLRNASAKRIVSITFDQNYRQVMAYLHQNQLDVAGVDFRHRRIDLVVSGREAELLKQAGVPFQFKNTKEGVEAPDQEYKTSQEIESILKEYAQRYPALSQVMQFGSSLEGRPIFVMKITSNAKQQQRRKPAVLFNGMHHAREVMSPEVPLDIIDTLLTGYGKDPRITHWVDTNEIWVVPMINVDGNNKVWSSDTMWRKNARGGYGVDINRNYPYAWGSCDGSSGATWSQTYRGESGGSEPETQALMNLVAKVRPVFDISFHSYSEMVLYPYGCRGQKTLTHEVVAGLGKQMASLLPSDDGQGTYAAGTPWEILYSVDGDDTSWMYHDMQVIPYVIELNSSTQGFQPKYAQWRDRTVLKLRAAWQLLLNRLDATGLRGLVGDNRGQPVPGAMIKIQRAEQPKFAQTYTVNPDGTYHVVLNPGKYQLVFQAPGYASKQFEVDLKEMRQDGNIALDKI